MAQKIGSLIISLALESGAFKSGLTLSEKELKASVKRMKAVGDSMKSFGQTMSLAVTLPFAALAKSSIEAAMQSKDALAQVQQGIKSMGNAAGRSAEQLQALASKEMHQSLYDDDDILRKVTSTLLTFGNVTGNTFDQAQQAAIDLSAALGQDLQSSTIQLGKALNDPIKGITALQRVGVSFTQQQKDQIKAMVEVGNTAGAQQVILAELNKEFGGRAAAAFKANPMAALSHAMDDFKEAVGGQLLQALPAITSALTSMLTAFNNLSPGAQKAIVVVGVLAAAFGPILMVVGSVVTALSGIGGAFTLVAGAIGGMAGIVTAAGATFGALIPVLAPILIPLAAVAAAAFAVYEAWKHWDAIKGWLSSVGAAISGFWSAHVSPVISSIIGAVWRGIKIWWDMEVGVLSAIGKLVIGVRDWLVTKMDAIWKWVGDKITWVKNAFFGLYDAVVGHSYIPDMVDGIAQHMARLDAVMVEPAKKATDRVREEFKKLQDDLKELMARLFPEAEALNQYRSDKATIDKGQKAGMLSPEEADAARARLKASAGGPSGAAMPENITDYGLGPLIDTQAIIVTMDGMKRAVNDNADGIAQANGRIVRSFADMARDTIGAMQNMVGAIQGGGFLDILQGVLGLFTQLGSIGAFGSKIQGQINLPSGTPPYAPGRAVGGPVSSWQPYIVGERGPELFIPGANGKIVPNHALSGGGGGGGTVQIVPSKYFDVVVDGRVMRAAPAIMNGGADLAQQNLGAQQFRSLAR